MDHEGEFLLRAQASARQAGPDPVKMDFLVDGQTVQAFDVMAPATLEPLPNQRLFDINLLDARPYVYEAKVKLSPGQKTFAAAFTNEFDDPKATNLNLRCAESDY